MDARAAELWPHAPAILGKLDSVIGKPKDVAKEELLSVLSLDGGPQTVEDSKPGVEDFEYALQAAVMKRLESKDEATVSEVAKIVEVAADVVSELFEKASTPGSPQAETDRCKSWWMMLIQVTEETTKLVPARLLERLVEVFEVSLVKLQIASLGLASQRLKEFDAKQEAEVKAAEESAAAEEGKSNGKAAKEAKDREVKRLDERRKLIAQLGNSPNGHLYLTLTSLLKQLSTRLAGSFNSSLRARISLLLENLLALDHKAIANNQKLRTQEYVILDDLDEMSQATFAGGSAVLAATEAAEAAETAETAKEEPAMTADGVKDASKDNKKEAVKASSLGNDPVVDYQLYKSFWGLQEPLQFVEKLFEKPENWQNFHGTLSKLLSQFVKYPAPDYARQPWAPQEPAPLRQAPRSRGLGTQLDDPNFRMQFLTQVMIACQALEQDVSSRRDRPGGLISQQSDAVRAEFRQLKKTVEKTLEQTRKGYPDMLKHILSREAHWVSWKGFGCREYERESLEMLYGRTMESDAIPEDPEVMRSFRPKLEPHVNSMLKTLKDPQWRVAPPVPAGDEETLKASMRPSLLRNMCDRYLERLEEEDDPKNGIEDEYKAKKNRVFMWQARRLFGMQHLRVYARKDVYGKVDFMEFLRAAKNKQPNAEANSSQVPATESKEPAEAEPPSTAAEAEPAAAEAEPAAAEAEPAAEAVEPAAATAVGQEEKAQTEPAKEEVANTASADAAEVAKDGGVADATDKGAKRPASADTPAAAPEESAEPPAKKAKQ